MTPMTMAYAVESVEKRDRRRSRELAKLGEFKHALKYMNSPIEALHWTRGLMATWDAVRRIAAELMGVEVRSIPLAWQIVYYVKALPDGAKRLSLATRAAVERWDKEAGAS